jgi:hypothetical protein
LIRRLNDLAHLLQCDIRQADRLATTVINEALERLRRIAQCHPPIIDRLTTLALGSCSSPEGKRGVNEIAIDIVNLQSPETCIKGGFEPFRTMIGVP